MQRQQRRQLGRQHGGFERALTDRRTAAAILAIAVGRLRALDLALPQPVRDFLRRMRIGIRAAQCKNVAEAATQGLGVVHAIQRIELRYRLQSRHHAQAVLAALRQPGFQAA